jgi:hypothetical protein
MPRRSTRGDVIAALNRLVQEGVITSFQTRLFDKLATNEPEIRVTVPDPSTSDDALRQVRAALHPLGLHLTVEIDPPQAAPSQSVPPTEPWREQASFTGVIRGYPPTDAPKNLREAVAARGSSCTSLGPRSRCSAPRSAFNL